MLLYRLSVDISFLIDLTNILFYLGSLKQIDSQLNTNCQLISYAFINLIEITIILLKLS